MNKLIIIFISISLVIGAGVVLFIFYGSNDDNEQIVNNGNIVKESITSDSDQNANINTQTIKNINTAVNSNVVISDPKFGKLDNYYYRGQENPVIDIEFYTDTGVFYDNEISKILSDYPSYTRLIWKPFPMMDVFGEERLTFSEALYCAGEQNKFWQFADTISSGQFKPQNIFVSGQVFIDKNNTSINQANLDTQRFNDCLINRENKDLISQLYNQARDLGINGAPITYVNANEIEGANEGPLRQAVNEELRNLVMLNWIEKNIPIHNVKLLIPDGYNVDEISESELVTRFDLTNKVTGSVIQIFFYNDSATYINRRDMISNSYEIGNSGGHIIGDIVWYWKDLTSKISEKNKYRINADFSVTEIVDGVAESTVEFFAEIMGDIDDGTQETAKIITLGVEPIK